MNAKRRKFVAEYLKEANATKAALAAGYSKKTSYSIGQHLLKKPEIARAIEKHLAKLDLTAERVLREIMLLGFSNMDDYVDIVDDKRVLNTGKATRDQMAAVQEITEDTTGGEGDGERKSVLRTRFKLVDKGANLERLGRHLKLFTDKIEHSGLDGLADRLHKIRQRKNAS